MEINSTVKKSEDEGFLEMPAEGLDAQLDDILDEVVDLAQDMRAKELIQDDLAPGGEGANFDSILWRSECKLRDVIHTFAWS